MKATLTMPLVTRDPCTTQNYVLVLGHNIPNHARYMLATSSCHHKQKLSATRCVLFIATQCMKTANQIAYLQGGPNAHLPHPLPPILTVKHRATVLAELEELDRTGRGGA